MDRAEGLVTRKVFFFFFCLFCFLKKGKPTIITNSHSFLFWFLRGKQFFLYILYYS